MELSDLEPHIADVFRDKPLMAFSLYSAGQVDHLLHLGDRLRAIAGNWPQTDNGRTITDFNEYYYGFWLWVLGSYEVVRTMCQHRERCFVPALADRAMAAKNSLALVRIPFAKQEIRGGKGFVHAEPSVAAVRRGFVFYIGNHEIDSDELIEDTCNFFRSFRIEEIVRSIPRRSGA